MRFKVLNQHWYNTQQEFQHGFSFLSLPNQLWNEIVVNFVFEWFLLYLLSKLNSDKRPSSARSTYSKVHAKVLSSFPVHISLKSARSSVISLRSKSYIRFAFRLPFFWKYHEIKYAWNRIEKFCEFEKPTSNISKKCNKRDDWK